MRAIICGDKDVIGLPRWSIFAYPNYRKNPVPNAYLDPMARTQYVCRRHQCLGIQMRYKRYALYCLLVSSYSPFCKSPKESRVSITPQAPATVGAISNFDGRDQHKLCVLSTSFDSFSIDGCPDYADLPFYSKFHFMPQISIAASRACSDVLPV